ncbi:hypothetical protein C4D60_Mb01t25400 [Musa balbisiana]|uniref:Uncharacterized protein n=1 Tax=Musa balbisiana TaxID=52838 RepID=A0A4V4H7M1_MUSBA|nr:hypothetical protein C4D60_Mb01t25400 [Musa balbisiana]
MGAEADDSTPPPPPPPLPLRLPLVCKEDIPFGSKMGHLGRNDGYAIACLKEGRPIIIFTSSLGFGAVCSCVPLCLRFKVKP